MSRERCLRWDACLNVRDLGGYPASSGRLTRWGALVRADDYALSAPYLLEHYERLEDGLVRSELIEDMEGVSKETMLSLLAHVRDRHGGAEAYLTAGGATPDEIAALARRLTERG